MQPSASSLGHPNAAQTRRSPPSSTQTIAVLLLAFGLRLLVLRNVLAHYPTGWFFHRGVEMGLLAQSIVAGRGLSSPFGAPTGPTAFIAPGYPVLVAAVFRLLGSESVASLVFLIGLQIGVNLLTVWLILYVTRLLAGSRAAWIASLFWACSPPLLWIPTIFWDTSLSACILLGFVAAALRLRGRFQPRTAFLWGAALGLTGLLNPALLPATGCIVLWAASQATPPAPRKFARLLLCVLAFTIVFSPWPIRNARVFHAFIPLRTTVGFELWMGNRPGASGFLDESLFPMYNPAELDAYRTLGEVAYTNQKSSLARAYILHHPGTFLELTARRIARFWTGTGSQGGSAIFGLHACLTFALGLTGLFLLYRRKARSSAWLLTLPLLVFPFPYYITHAEFRYRLVIDPLLTILAGCAVAWLWKSADPNEHTGDSSTDSPESRPVHLA